jgi:hypothetical protein
MKNAFATMFVLAVMSYAMMPSYGQDGTNRAEALESNFKGVLIIVKPTEEPYRVGSPMIASITITNVSKEDIIVLHTRPPTEEYRISVFSDDGTPIRAPATVGDNGMRSGYQRTIISGQSDSMKLDLANFIHIENAGVYYLIIERHIATQWDTKWVPRFVASDRIKIKVVK